MELSSFQKRILAAIGLLVLVFLLGWALYFIFFREVPVPSLENINVAPGELPIAGPYEPREPSEVPDGAPSFPTAPGALIPEAKVSEIASGGLTKISEISPLMAQDTTLAQGGQDLLYYSRYEGKFYRLNPQGKKELLSDKVFHEVEKVNWAPNKTKAILEYPDESKILYDFNSEKQVTLPDHWRDFSFSPSSEQIVFKSIGLDPENRWLATASADGSKAKMVEKMVGVGLTVDVNWSPNDQVIATYREDVDGERQELFLVGKHKENFKSTIVEGRGFEGQWSPEGDRIIYSAYHSRDDFKPRLWIVNAQGDSIGTGRHDLGLETWADKCTFAGSDTAYCAVPKEPLPYAAGLMPYLAVDIPDKIYKINLKTGVKTVLADPYGDDYTVESMMVSGDGKNLYLTTETLNRIYKIRLK